MWTLLSRNGLWNEYVLQYLAAVVAECRDCKAASSPSPNRRVLISSFDWSFNDVVGLAHFHLGNMTLFHGIYVATRFIAAHVVLSTAMNSAIYDFELIWISQFWLPGAVHADGAFQTEPFKPLQFHCNIQIRPIPTLHHQKNMIEP